jgi:hypothetical protein
MRLLAPALLLALSCFAADNIDELAPQIKTVVPRVVKPGDTVIITGIQLGAERVQDLYLSDHKFDMKVKVLDQNPGMIKFRIPPFAKAGRLQLLMLMKPEKDDDPKLLEIPAYLLIEDVPATEITQTQPADKSGKAATQEQKGQKDPQNP